MYAQQASLAQYDAVGAADIRDLTDAEIDLIAGGPAWKVVVVVNLVVASVKVSCSGGKKNK